MADADPGTRDAFTEPPPERTETMPAAEDSTAVITQAAQEARQRSMERRRAGMKPDRGILLLWSAGVFVLAVLLILRLT